MDPHAFTELAERLAADPHDADALSRAHAAGQADPRAYATFLEGVAGRSTEERYRGHWLGEASSVWLHALDDVDRAKDAVRRALAHDAGNPRALRVARLLCERAGRPAEARAILDRELSLVTAIADRVELLVAKARLLRAEGDLAGAASALRSVRAVDAGETAFADELATILLERIARGDAVSDEERHEAADLLLGLAVAHTGQAALRYALQALDADPGHERALAVATEWAEADGEADQLASRWAAYLFHHADGALANNLRRRLAAAHERAGCLGDAIVTLAPLADAGDLDAEARVLALAEAEGNVGELGKRRTARALRLPASERLDELAAVAALYEAHARTDDAARAWHLVLGLAPAHAHAFALVTAHLRRHERWVELQATLVAAAREPSTPPATAREHLREAARLGERTGDVAAVAPLWRELAQADPSDAEASQAWLRFLERSGRWTELAAAVVERAEAERDDAARAGLLGRAADLLIQAGDHPGALARYEQAVALVPANDDWATAVELRYAAAGRYDALATFLLDRADRLPDRPRRLALRKRAGAMLEHRLGAPERAADAFRAALADGDDAEALASLADLAEHLSRFDVAVDALDRLALATVDATARRNALARAATLASSRLGDDAGALRRWESLLASVDADDPAALAGVAAASERLGDHARFAAALERLAARAASAAERLALARRLARVYDGPLDDPQRASLFLARVLELDPDDRTAAARLALVYERLGRTGDARALRVAVVRAAVAEATTLDAIDRLAAAATEADGAHGGTEHRLALAEALASAPPSAADGGRLTSARLRRAALIAQRELGDLDRAFEWLGDSLAARVEGAFATALEQAAQRNR